MNSFNRNDDGAGLAYVQDGKLVIKRNMRDAEEFVQAVQAVEDLELIIHCRLTSRGDNSDANGHPFAIESVQHPHIHGALIHNGTLAWRHTTTESDTNCFVSDFMTPVLDRDPWFLNNQYGRAMLGAYIGRENKFIVMQWDEQDKELFVNVINRASGIEYNGCWFSNLSFSDDVGRNIFDSDHKRFKTWTPKLYRAVKTVGGYGYGGRFQEDFDYGPHGHGTSTTSNKEGHTTPATDGYPLGKGGWRYDAGYGWYNEHPDYKGSRCLKDYERHVAASKAAKSESTTTAISAETAGKIAETIKIAGIGDVDNLNYLNNKQMAKARKECVAIVRESFPGYDFKGCSTQEIAAYARAEVRSMFPEIQGLTNPQLMNLIMNGTIMQSVEEGSSSQ